MPFSKTSILIVEDDSHISRVLRNHLELAFSNVRIEIAGSATKAKQVCEKFPPNLIIWDGAPNERGHQQEYIDCIPDAQWPSVLPICTDEASQKMAQSKGSHPALPKRNQAINAWSEDVAAFAKKVLSGKSKR